MHSHLNFYPGIGTAAAIKHGELPAVSAFPIKSAEAFHYPIHNGEVLRQSINNDTVHLEMFEYGLSSTSKIEFSVNGPAMFLFMMLQGSSQLYDKAGKLITETYENTCFLCHLNPADYYCQLAEGDHKMLLLTIRPEWLLTKAEKLTELRPLAVHFINQVSSPLLLAQTIFNKNLHKSLLKLAEVSSAEYTRLDTELYSLLNDLILFYNQRLAAHETTSAFAERTSKEIQKYVTENFNNAIVNDKEALARLFKISQRTLLRQAKRAFGISLHQEVIRLRMLYSIKALMTTDKNVYEIAHEMGYKDSHYFSRAFKKHHGVVPTLIIRPRK